MAGVSPHIKQQGEERTGTEKAQSKSGLCCAAADTLVEFHVNSSPRGLLHFIDFLPHSHNINVLFFVVEAGHFMYFNNKLIN